MFTTCTMNMGTFTIRVNNKNVKSVIFYNTGSKSKKWIHIVDTDDNNKDLTGKEIFVNSPEINHKFQLLIRAGASFATLS